MSRVNDYRRAVNGLRPSPDWRRRTLAAMEDAAAGRRRARPVRHPLRWAAVLAAVFLAAFAGALWLTAQGFPWSGETRSAHPGRLERREGVYTFLLAATSPSSDLTDCMMAVTYDSRAQTVRLLSLPRDTQIDAVRRSDGRPLTNLNFVYAENGVEALRAQAAGMLGYPIDYYVIIDPQGFVELVDAMGGVEFDVPQDMDYEDPTQGIRIHLEAGEQLLDGEGALGMALFRHTSDSEGHILGGYPDGDLDRTAVQRDLLAAVLERALSQPQQFPDYVSLFLEHVKTDLTAPELLELAGKAAGLELPGALEGFLLPGGSSGTSSSYVPDPQGIWELVNAERFHPYTTDLPAPAPLAADPDGTADPPLPDNVWSLSDAGGWITIVEDPAQQMGSNPTEGRLDELTELPVYYNAKPTETQQMARLEALAGELGLTITSSQWYEGTVEPSQGWAPSLWADCADGSSLRLNGLNGLDFLSYTPPLEALYGLYSTAADPTLWSTERIESCAYSGSLQGTDVWYYDDPGASLAQQLYNYSFLRFSITDSGSVQMTLPPAGEGTVCPIRTAEEAVALFRSGDYWSGMETAYPERAEILQVTLEYAAEDYQEYIQPVYRILFTQDYWDVYLAEWMDDEVDASRFTGVAVAYVPAVDGLNFQMYANDWEVHRTPS